MLPDIGRCRIFIYDPSFYFQVKDSIDNLQFSTSLRLPYLLENLLHVSFYS